MKPLILLGLTLLIAFLLNSCKKNSVADSDTNPTIMGKWDIQSDSKFVGVGIYNHSLSYTGQTGDYFDFRTNGNVYVKEGPVLDTINYTLTSDTTILIASFGIVLNGIPQTSHIANLTAHHVTINTPNVITPGGQFGRKMILSR